MATINTPLRPLDSSPDSFGAHKASIFPHQGPAAYAQVVIDSPPDAVPASGGDVVQAVEAGLKLFDIVLGSLSDSGVYFVKSVPVSRSDYLNGAQLTTYRLQWFVTATGAEVAAEVDLSGECVRLFALGTK